MPQKGSELGVDLVRMIDTLKKAAKKKGITYAEISHNTGIPESTLKKIFMGKDFHLSQFFKITSAIGIDPADILASPKEQSFHLNEMQESLFLQDLDCYRVFILFLQKLDMKSIGNRLEMDHQKVTGYVKDLESVGLVERHAGDQVKVVPKGPLQMESGSKLMALLESKAAFRLMEELYNGSDAPVVRHVGSMRVTKDTLEAIRKKSVELDSLILNAAARDVRLSRPDDLINLTYMLAAATIDTRLAGEGH